tara:strand:+ start:269 stop:502 length:234 start_codon:yes stop_codon:yes gene_type:complete
VGDLDGASLALSQAMSRNEQDLEALLHHGRLLQVRGDRDSMSSAAAKLLLLQMEAAGVGRRQAYARVLARYPRSATE